MGLVRTGLGLVSENWVNVAGGEGNLCFVGSFRCTVVDFAIKLSIIRRPRLSCS